MNLTSGLNRIHIGDALTVLRTMPNEYVDTIVTSPPYYNVRDYQVDGQVGLEETPELYIARLVEIFAEARRVLRSTGVVLLNMGDSFCSGKGRYSSKAQTLSGHGRDEPSEGNHRDLRHHAIYKDKDKMLIPHRLAIALHEIGWYVRSDMPWVKASSLPESIKDRPSVAHEYLFLLTKSPRYYWNADAIRKPLAFDTLPRMSRGMNENKWTNGPKEASGTSLDHPERFNVPAAKPHSLHAPRQRALSDDLQEEEPSLPLPMMRFYGADSKGNYDGQATKDYDSARAQNPSDTKRRILASIKGRAEKKAVAVWKERAEETGVTGADGRNQRRVSGLDDMHAEERARKMEGTGFGGDGAGLHGHSGYYDKDGTPRFNEAGRNYRSTDPFNDTLDAAISDAEEHLAYLQSMKEQGLHLDTEGNPLVLRINPRAFKGNHFAVFPEALVEPFILAACPPDGVVLDPFAGAGTVAVVAKRLGRRYIGIELNPAYVEMAEARIAKEVHQPSLSEGDSG